MKVEFLPDPSMLAAIAKEMKSSHRAFPLFGTAKLFLSKQERHHVRLTSIDENAPLYQLGEGAISLDRSLIERDAFRQLKDEYYREEVQQTEPPKGIFTNVARLRGGGLLLGPTNYHSYQPSLRRIYEERYSRRMSFPEFQQREIEVVSDEQTINDWKEQARSIVTYVTTQEPEPVTFKSLAEVEAHFRTKYLPQELKTGRTFEARGIVVRAAGDRAMSAALREAFDREMAFPAGMVNAIRPALVEAGLHFFKHRKRIVYATAVRPQRYPEGQPARETVLAILKAIEANPKCTRHDLALKLLGAEFEAPERVQEKTALAADLHYLLLAGHVIEFPDGRLDLPLPPKAQAHADAKGEAVGEHEADEGPEQPAAALAANAPAPAPESPSPAAAEAAAVVSPEPEPEPEVTPEPQPLASAAEAPSAVPDVPAATPAEASASLDDPGSVPTLSAPAPISPQPPLTSIEPAPTE